MILGCAWYPEHWDEARWPEDIRLMRLAGINMVRIAEFAWSRMEPREGQFTLDWLERAVALAGKAGVSSVIGTPTAAPPAWLTQQYPETLKVYETGQCATHGGRCHYSPASPKYRELCRPIVEQMARRFGPNPHVIGWQIDNEYNSVSYDPETQRQFQAWLQRKYGTLEELNEHWSGAYWSEDYTDWAQIPLPVGNHNPGLRIDFRRFISYLYKTFQKEQVDIIRRYATSEQFITHNFMGWFDLFDHYVVSEDLDLASWDNYVATGHLDFRTNGAGHDLTRGFKRKNFWLMETQPGACTWGGVNNNPDRGEVRSMAWHAVGHGADAVSYWQWRSAPNNQEQYHGTIIAADGNPRPNYEEIAQLGQEFVLVADLLKDTTPVSQVAILHSYDDRWALDFQRHHKDFDPVQHTLSYYKPLREAGYDVDIVHPLAPFTDYRVVIAPHLHLLDEARVNHLTEYVQGGGHLVLGPRSGFKDLYNALLPARQPGPLAASLGAHVEEYFALEGPVAVAGPWGTGEAIIWAEWLQTDAPDAEVMLRYRPSNGWLDDQPAMVTRRVGMGRITYIGAWFDEALMRKVTHWLASTSGLVNEFAELPEGVEICRRFGLQKQAFIIINHNPHPVQVGLPHPMRDLLTNALNRQWVILTPHEVGVLVTA